MSDAIRISKHDRESLETMARKLGTSGAARALEVNPATLARAIAGLGVQRATVTHLRAKLLETPKPSA